MARQELNARIAQRVEVAPGLLVLRVVPDGWSLPDFEPGQFAVLGLPAESVRCPASDGEDPGSSPGRLIRRAYSIASSSRAHTFLEFYITLVRSGSLTPRLFALAPGDRVWLGPRIAGAFTLDQAPEHTDVVMVATGTGLAPYMSMLRSGPPGWRQRRFAVLLGARHAADLGYHSELETLARLSDNFDYLPVISRPEEEPTPWRGRTGYVQSLWRDGDLAAVWGFTPAPATTSVFLCGNPTMIEEMLAVLAAEGFREHRKAEPGQVFVEKYW
jgi:ferredoxin--NADP+ reductase